MCQPPTLNKPRSSASRIVLCLALAFSVLGCTQPVEQASESAKPVKIERIEPQHLLSQESFVGNVRAEQRTDLSFETAGRVAAIAVEVGDRVRAGQVLARLDDTPARAQLLKAEAALAAAEAALLDKDTQLQRTRQLAKEQVLSAAVLEGAEAQQQAAVSQQQAAQAALSIARRDLAFSQIKAPYDGRIVARTIQPFANVGAAQTVLQIEGNGPLEVVVALPDNLASKISTGQDAVLNASTATGGKPLALRLSKLSERADSGSQVQAIFRVVGVAPALRSGSSVSISLAQAPRDTISIPASALLPGTQPGSGDVFILNEYDQRLARRRIAFAPALVQAGRIEVQSGLRAGDRVVTAGAAYLNEGQLATPFTPQTQLQDGTL